MVNSLREGFAQLIKIQGAFTLLLILFTDRFLTFVGLGAVQSGSFQTTAIGVFLLVLFLSHLTIFFYLGKLRDAMFCCLVFTLVNGGVTAWSIHSGEQWYGFGFLIASALATTISAARVNRHLGMLEVRHLHLPEHPWVTEMNSISITSDSWRLLLKTLAGIGDFVRQQCRALLYLMSVLGTTLFLSVQPAHWRRTVRRVLAQQGYFFGVQSVRFILMAAVLVGISVVAQLGVWTGKLGQSQTLGQLLALVVARELGPLFANFVLIVRGGSAIATELGIMKAGGEVRVLEAQGLEPIIFLVMPRVIAMAASAFCLTVVFVAVAFASGYGFGAFSAKPMRTPRFS